MMCFLPTKGGLNFLQCDENQGHHLAFVLVQGSAQGRCYLVLECCGGQRCINQELD